MKPLDIAILLSGGAASRGGIGRIMGNLENALDNRHGDIRAVLYSSRLTERLLLNHMTTPIALLRFAAICRAGKVDVAHINVAPRGSTWRKRLFAGIARRQGIPLVLHLHGSGYDAWFEGLSPGARARVSAFFCEADAVVVTGDYWRRFMIGTIKVAPERLHVVANGVGDRPPAPGSANKDIPTLVFMGIVGERKGVDVLLDALASDALRQRRWRMVIGGNGAVDKARQRARELGLSERIEFTGWIGPDQVDALLRGGSIYVLPSRQENQPMSILEAMAYALPVISTRIGAIPEQVVEGETGLLVAPGDAEALAGALTALLDDPDRRMKMGKAGQERQRRLFSIDSGADRFAKLYRSLTGRVTDGEA